MVVDRHQTSPPAPLLKRGEGGGGDEFVTPAEFLVRGLQLPALGIEPHEVPPGTVCAITGQPITAGYRVAEMVTDATAEFLDCFRGGVDGWVSEAAARCFKKSDPRQGNPCARSFLIFEDGTGWMPLINREAAAAQGRPAWTRLVREVWPARQGQRCLAILTTDTKKRLWPRARIGQLGERTPVLCYDSETEQNRILFVNWVELVRCLEMTEEVYSAGFPKADIRQTLYRVWNVLQKNGIERVWQWERELARWRGSDEFVMALLIVQKDSTDKEEEYVQSNLGLS